MIELTDGSDMLDPTPITIKKGYVDSAETIYHTVCETHDYQPKIHGFRYLFAEYSNQASMYEHHVGKQPPTWFDRLKESHIMR